MSATPSAGPSYVLIESDWNLKHTGENLRLPSVRINRIRLEFKDCTERFITEHDITRINRIRLEFKDYQEHHRKNCQTFQVLIESDWNLKEASKRANVQKAQRINRIRLEFKEQ